MKKFLRVLGNIIFALIIILMTIGLMGNLSAKSDKVYNIIKYRTYIIVSPSMKPTINPGDLIFVRKVNVDKIKEGDTLGGIAAKFRVSVKQLKAWNGLQSDFIRAGKTLKIGI